MLSIRKIGVISRTYRHLSRYRQILGVLIKYGFEGLVNALKIDQYIEVGLQMVSQKGRERLEKLTRAERVRMALIELGPTYVKLGQILSTRPDLVPVDFVRELAKLQDKVPPAAFEDIEPILSKELGAPLQEVFEHFEPEPVASASIGQVHLAQLKDGEAVAVKIQRPGIRKIVEVDLEIMLHLATLMERHLEEVAFHRPVRIVEEFADTLEKEIDYSTEATSNARMARQFINDPTVYIPKVFPELSTSRLLAMEYVQGVKISAVDRLERRGYDKKLLTERGSQIYLKQIFRHGFFHGDPHPGNIFVLPDNVICLLDFGMTGTIDRRTREHFVDLVDGIVQRQENRCAQVLLKLTEWDQEPDMYRLEKDVVDFTGRHLYKPLKEIEVARLLQELLELAAFHGLRIRPNIFLMLKALATVESVGRMLDPDFDMMGQIAPFIAQSKVERLQPQRIADDLTVIATDLMAFLRQFPSELLDVIRLIRQRKLSLRHESADTETILATYSQISNRISFAIIIAALLIGSALIVISEIPPLLYGISLIGIIVFFAAAIMGIWLLIAILKTGRL